MTTNTVPGIMDVLYDEMAMTFTKSELIVQHSMSCLTLKMMTVPELMPKLVMNVSESSVREAVDKLISLGFIHKIDFSDKSVFGLTEKGSHVSPAVKKILFSQKSLF